MHHIHLEQCKSTQTLLKEKFVDLSQPILVSTDNQIEGFGRKGSEWNHLDYALAFSFTLPLNQTLTLTPLEIGCLLCDFFSPNLLMKWPNDLINERSEKVGGILCQLVGKNLVVGIGLNLYCPSPTELDYPIGGVFKDLPIFECDYKKTLPAKIYDFLAKNRREPLSVRKIFNKYCSHLQKQVLIVDGGNKSEGLFVGISDQGEAILELKDGEQRKVLTGSLRY